MLSDALDVLGLAVAVVTTYIGFGIVVAGFALTAALFVASVLFDKSGRPEFPRLPVRKPRRIDVDQGILTNGKVDAELVKRG